LKGHTEEELSMQLKFNSNQIEKKLDAYWWRKFKQPSIFFTTCCYIPITEIWKFVIFFSSKIGDFGPF
jgi:hypothetical protein